MLVKEKCSVFDILALVAAGYSPINVRWHHDEPGINCVIPCYIAEWYEEDEED